MNEPLKTLVEMYAEMKGIKSDEYFVVIKPDDSVVRDPKQPDFTDLNICFEILEWWVVDTGGYCVHTISRRVGKIYHRIGLGRNPNHAIEEEDEVVIRDESLPTAIAEALHKMKDTQ